MCIGDDLPLDLRMASGRRRVHARHAAHTEVHAYRRRPPIVLRQNPCVDYEANLVYLLIGTSARCSSTAAPWKEPRRRRWWRLVRLALERAGEGTLAAARGAHPRPPGPSRRRRGVRRAPEHRRSRRIESEAMRKFLGFKDWPNGVAQIDLGGRIVDLIPTPGHHEDHIVFYDRKYAAAVHGRFPAAGPVVGR